MRKERLDRGIKVRSDGLYAIASWREMAYKLAPRLALIVGLLLLPLLVPNMYWQRVLCSVGLFALLALSFDFLASHVGLICLGGAFFTGVGGYTAALLNSYYDLPIYVTLPVATVGGGLICTILLLPCLPLRGVYFAVVTLIYPLAASKIITALGIWGGTEGITVYDSLPNIWVEVYLILGLTLVVLFGLRRLVREDYGLVLQGIRGNEQAVRASGIDPTRRKAQAVFIAASIGCFSGAYLSHMYNWGGLSLLAMDFSVIPIAAAVVGGMGPLSGSVLGALILVPLSESLRALGTWRIVFYSLILLCAVLFRPEGLMNYLERKYHQFEHSVEV